MSPQALFLLGRLSLPFSGITIPRLHPRLTCVFADVSNHIIRSLVAFISDSPHCTWPGSTPLGSFPRDERLDPKPLVTSCACRIPLMLPALVNQSAYQGLR
jgi:hypothetical protein